MPRGLVDRLIGSLGWHVGSTNTRSIPVCDQVFSYFKYRKYKQLVQLLENFYVFYNVFYALYRVFVFTTRRCRNRQVKEITRPGRCLTISVDNRRHTYCYIGLCISIIGLPRCLSFVSACFVYYFVFTLLSQHWVKCLMTVDLQAHSNWQLTSSVATSLPVTLLLHLAGLVNQKTICLTVLTSHTTLTEHSGLKSHRCCDFGDHMRLQ